MADSILDYVKEIKCEIRQPRFYPSLDPTVAVRSDFVKERFCTIRRSEFNLEHNRMVENESDPDKEKTVGFLSDLDGPNVIYWSELIYMSII